MSFTATTPQCIINTDLGVRCQHLLPVLVFYRENRLGLIDYHHITGEFVQLVLLMQRQVFALVLIMIEYSDELILFCLPQT